MEGQVMRPASSFSSISRTQALGGDSVTTSRIRTVWDSAFSTFDMALSARHRLGFPHALYHTVPFCLQASYTRHDEAFLVKYRAAVLQLQPTVSTVLSQVQASVSPPRNRTPLLSPSEQPCRCGSSSGDPGRVPRFTESPRLRDTVDAALYLLQNLQPTTKRKTQPYNQQILR